ncbi:hypothetical protein SAMN05192588_0809 [Nonlabens sp. Hel1_33_55]|uniref:hypothetical protein n=1 Tax=Nonlabens sp. Hel1_33_55 TaxID=1336802 RepID=UPI000875D783|nr:hypothetical protein [Nonlabens sp. Hel1_33_55]SCY03056.1 hypothetical protein SAMN05192588_0809 [Nonlabens sp. Hel1_33_55]
MSNYKISDEIAVKMKLHYQQEYSQTLKKLGELKAVLDELSNVDTGIPESQSVVSAENISPQNDRGNQVTPSEKPKRKYKKKPGRKSIWGKFILSRLKATRTPLSYDDMTSHAIAIKNLEPTEFDKIRKKIIASAFVLRTKQDKIDNFAIKGSRTKYMGLKEWYEREGLLKEEYRTKIVTN